MSVHLDRRRFFDCFEIYNTFLQSYMQFVEELGLELKVPTSKFKGFFLN